MPGRAPGRSKGDSASNLSDMVSSFNLTGSAANLLANLGMSLKDREARSAEMAIDPNERLKQW